MIANPSHATARVRIHVIGAPVPKTGMSDWIAHNLFLLYPPEPVEHDPFGPLIEDVDKPFDGEQPWNPDYELFHGAP